jgi:outer membrane protein assembly factor BamB
MATGLDKRMRKAIGIALLVATVAAGAMLGCGGKIEPPGELYKEPRRSVYLYAGEYSGFSGASWLGVTGGRLFATFPENGTVVAFRSTGAVEAGVEFTGTLKPYLIGIGTYEIAVADSADSVVTVRCYGIGGGEPLWEVEDEEWVEIGGLAVGDDGLTYVSDASRNFVRAYDKDGKLLFGRDLADSGFGLGHVLSPRGIFIEADTLYIAEANEEKAQVQRVSVRQPQTGIPFSGERPFLSSFIDTLGIELPLVEPLAVCVNSVGQIFVLDAGYGVIIEYNRDGTTEAVVTAPSSGGPFPLTDVNSMGPYSLRIYALEPPAGVVHRWDKTGGQQP